MSQLALAAEAEVSARHLCFLETGRAQPSRDMVLLLSRVVTRLGSLREINPGTIEGLFASDLAFLQDLYRRINQEGQTQAAVECPACKHQFTVDMAGGRLGGA